MLPPEEFGAGETNKVIRAGLQTLMPTKSGSDRSLHSHDVTEVLPGSSAQWRSLDVSEGDVLAGRFEVTGRLGKGAMGAVFKARDKTLDKYVALKFRLPEEEDSEETRGNRRQRFLEEVKQAQQISHPNICRIHDVWTTRNHEFLSMELIEGEDLERKLLREGALEIEEALRLGIEICAGLGAIHAKGLFHQDLKPANVMIHPKEGAKISDFGLTDHHFQGGTRRYASPEQLIERKVYVQSDLFSFGLILYEMLTGRRGFDTDALEGSAPEPIWKLRPEVPSEIEEIVFRCLQQDPLRRPKDAVEVEQILRKIADNFASSKRRGKTGSGIVAAVTLLILLVGLWVGIRWFDRGQKGEDPRTEDDVLPPWVRGDPERTGEREWPRDGSLLVEVPAGEFVLGSENLDADSRPVHRVWLSPFWITKVPITHAQFQVFLENNPEEAPPKLWKDVDHGDAWQPLVGATWGAARRYCSWAGMDLPTEAQWEAAARGRPDQERYPYPWGKEPPSGELAHFSETSVGPTRPEQVGNFPLGVGPFGVLDQLGNVWEWCRDGWNSRAYDGREGQSDPLGPFQGATEMVVRGGSYQSRARDLHVSFRASLRRDRQNELTGFRCVYEPDRSELASEHASDSRRSNGG